MPSLSWRGKREGGVPPPQPPPSILKDSIIYPGGNGYPDSQPRDRLILGDNLRVMSALLPEYEGRVRLIYADPPFFTNREYSARIGRGEDSRKPAEWALREGYHDNWPDLDAYLDFLFQRLQLMHRLLAANGTLYLHLDWHADAYGRLLLDEIFGSDRILNEIIWTYHGPSPIRRAFNRKHDTILAYTKDSDYSFNADAVRQPYDAATVRTFSTSSKAGFGKVPDLARGKVPEDWWYFPVVARLHAERTGYPTQKPQGLLERIILASSNPGDLVADFFCGSGTSAAVAARLGRRFFASDSNFRAVHTTRARLCGSMTEPFMVEREQEARFPCAKGEGPVARRIPGRVQVNPNGHLDYWEVDPAWDGTVFRSAAQAIRPRRKGELPKELEIKTGPTACVRFVTVDAEMAQRQLDV